MHKLSSNQNTPPTKSLVHVEKRNFLRASVAGIAASVFGGVHSTLAQPTDGIEASQKFLAERYGIDIEKKSTSYDAAWKKRIVEAGPIETTLWHEFLWPAKHELISSLSGGFRLNPEMMRRLVIIESEGKTSAVSSQWAQGLMQIMPDTLNDIARRYGSRYDQLIRTLTPASFAKFSEKETRYFVNEFFSRDYQTRERAMRALVGLSNKDPEVNLLVGIIYFARLKMDVIANTSHMEFVLPKLVNLSTSEIAVINGHRSKLKAPAIPLQGTEQFLTRAIENNPERQVYLATLAQYNGWGKPPSSSYAYAATIAL